uniref:Uncharacterized protein n=1 Tax=Mycena chlorophos TaxID=658473 RepID=A0ABQ0KY91_MYCCL|nr:predicted protein [Mycena chlorophos]
MSRPRSKRAPAGLDPADAPGGSTSVRRSTRSRGQIADAKVDESTIQPDQEKKRKRSTDTSPAPSYVGMHTRARLSLTIHSRGRGRKGRKGAARKKPQAKHKDDNDDDDENNDDGNGNGNDEEGAQSPSRKKARVASPARSLSSLSAVDEEDVAPPARSLSPLSAVNEEDDAEGPSGRNVEITAESATADASVTADASATSAIVDASATAAALEIADASATGDASATDDALEIADASAILTVVAPQPAVESTVIGPMNVEQPILVAESQTAGELDVVMKEGSETGDASATDAASASNVGEPKTAGEFDVIMEDAPPPQTGAAVIADSPASPDGGPVCPPPDIEDWEEFESWMTNEGKTPQPDHISSDPLNAWSPLADDLPPNNGSPSRVSDREGDGSVSPSVSEVWRRRQSPVSEGDDVSDHIGDRVKDRVSDHHVSDDESEYKSSKDSSDESSEDEVPVPTAVPASKKPASKNPASKKPAPEMPAQAKMPVPKTPTPKPAPSAAPRNESSLAADHGWEPWKAGEWSEEHRVYARDDFRRYWDPHSDKWREWNDWNGPVYPANYEPVLPPADDEIPDWRPRPRVQQRPLPDEWKASLSSRLAPDDEDDGMEAYPTYDEVRTDRARAPFRPQPPVDVDANRARHRVVSQRYKVHNRERVKASNLNTAQFNRDVKFFAEAKKIPIAGLGIAEVRAALRAKGFDPTNRDLIQNDPAVQARHRVKLERKDDDDAAALRARPARVSKYKSRETIENSEDEEPPATEPTSKAQGKQKAVAAPAPPATRTQRPVEAPIPRAPSQRVYVLPEECAFPYPDTDEIFSWTDFGDSLQGTRKGFQIWLPEDEAWFTFASYGGGSCIGGTRVLRGRFHIPNHRWVRGGGGFDAGDGGEGDDYHRNYNDGDDEDDDGQDPPAGSHGQALGLHEPGPSSKRTDASSSSKRSKDTVNEKNAQQSDVDDGKVAQRGPAGRTRKTFPPYTLGPGQELGPDNSLPVGARIYPRNFRLPAQIEGTLWTRHGEDWMSSSDAVFLKMCDEAGIGWRRVADAEGYVIAAGVERLKGVNWSA